MNVENYLLDKIRTVNENNPRANSGARLLKMNSDYENDTERFVSMARHTIQINFVHDTSSNPAGTAKLTNVSTRIGLMICQVLKLDDSTWFDHVRLGDLFIEAFYNCKLIDIYYDYLGKERSQYILAASTEWEKANPTSTGRSNLPYTVDELPESIAGPMQDILGTAHPIIKGGTFNDPIDLDATYIKSLDKLQQTPWRINRKVFNAVLNNPDPKLSIPYDDLKDPKELKRRSKVLERKFILSKARELKDKDQFYQYVDTDYRGRVYYKEAFLSFQGSDVARGMLKFANAKPMTKDGMKWLAIHTASSYNMSYGVDEIPEWCESDYKTYLQSEGLDDISVDKMTLADRVQWVNKHMDLIRTLGYNEEFDNKADKKVSFLACCIEWYDIHEAAALRKVHMTRLPIPIDGSNNGWQHLGVMSKDTQTGELVGLIPREIQKDFYVQTAKEVKRLATDERIIGILEAMPMKNIRKGISKRGSMTRAYSSGAKKIAENMFFDCRAEGYDELYGVTQDDCTKLSKLLVKAIANVCPGPLETMAYFQGLADFEIGKTTKEKDGVEAHKEYRKLVKEQQALYNKAGKTDEEVELCGQLLEEVRSYDTVPVYGNHKEHISWSTPSGFNVIYKKFRMNKQRCKGTIKGYKSKDSTSDRRIHHVAQVPTKFPDGRAMMCGISPNIVHSYDASHMSIVINKWSGSFAAVHDSFSTHACDVDDLLSLTKEVFIDMYEAEDFYDKIKSEILTEAGEESPVKPQTGSLEIQEIHNSDYFFA